MALSGLRVGSPSLALQHATSHGGRRSGEHKWNAGRRRLICPPTRTRTHRKGQCRLAQVGREKRQGQNWWWWSGGGQSGSLHCPCSRRREKGKPTQRNLHHTDRQDSPFCGGQIFQSQGLVSIDRSMVAALLSTTPRLTPRSSANDLAPRHCTGMDIASASGKELSRPDPP